MLARLESRLKLLTGGARDLPARQQTLRGAISWSYELLDPAERTLFARMSVFVGGPSDWHGNDQTAGAMAQEVFKAAGDPNMFPEQLRTGLRA